MVPAALILFRESLEAVLVAGIVLGFLGRTGLQKQRIVVWLGIGAGVAASVAAAVLFQALAGGFEGRSEQIFEASTMLAGAALMLTLVAWVGRRGSPRASLEARAAQQGNRMASGNQAGAWGLFLLVFVSILREGVEAVLFMSAAAAGSAPSIGAPSQPALIPPMLAGGIVGLAAAVVLGILLLRASLRASLRSFFTVTNVLLVLFAAGLVANGLHELTEAGVLPPLVAKLWDMNPPLRADGTFPAMHDQGSVGVVLRGLFGYTGAPSLLGLIGWILTAAAAAGVWAAAGRRGSPGRRPQSRRR